jgi:hypothetical protein
MRDMELMNSKGDDAQTVILMPKYKKDERLNVDREFEMPPKSMFIGLGWDEDATTKKKHYRQYYDDELEFVTEIFPSPSPFNSYNIYHGVAKGDNEKPRLFSNLVNVKEDDS